MKTETLFKIKQSLLTILVSIPIVVGFFSVEHIEDTRIWVSVVAMMIYALLFIETKSMDSICGIISATIISAANSMILFEFNDIWFFATWATYLVGTFMLLLHIFITFENEKR